MKSASVPVLLSIAALGCDLEAVDSGATGTAEQEIIGGIEVTTDPEVVFLSTGIGNCTGTLVGRRLVLTAAHCVIGTQGGFVSFGDGVGSFFDQVGILRSLPHRYYNDGVVTKFDIAMIRLSQDAPPEVTPMAVNLDPLTEQDIGQSVRVVGFGVTDGQTQTGAGTKREVNLTIDALTTEHIGLGDMVRNICQGDSGGPTILLAGGEKVVAVSSFGSNFCMDQSFVTRTDAHADFLREVISSWGDGPCAQDGTCNAEGCEFLDPDCDDQCALDGTCANGCPRIDLDCPVTGFAGDFCTDGDDCETRNCIEAIDDPRITYCSESCDADNPCTTPLACVDGLCQYAEPTPSAQGAPCTTSAECRSGLCDATNFICVEPCDSSADCADPYACESLSGMKVCTFPKEGCLGCAASSPSGGRAAGTLALLFLAVIGYGAAFRRRRRRPKHD